MMELSDYRRGLFQWDTGRSLIVTEKDITEVHFQLLPPPSGSTETTDVPVSAGIAKIPDELLQSGLPIRAYAWGDGYSHYDQTFCVTKREKPTGYASDPSDAITLESVQAKLQYEIDGKIQMPQGGDAGDVLKKTESGVEWGQLSGGSDVPVVLRAVMNPDGTGGLDETSITKMDFISDSYKNGIPVPAILSIVVVVPGRSIHTWHQMDHVQITDGVGNFYFSTGSDGKIYIVPSTTNQKWNIITEAGT